ncbi:MAG: archaetidylserine decarboxylase [Bdellovibrionales bacterium]|nr:archaetidylserine decarboxylase [Bdellovibrionales bacterium]
MNFFWWGLLIVPKNILSRIFGYFSEKRWPDPWNQWILNWFIKKYRLNMHEAEGPVESYVTLQKLFTRKLKSNLRPLAKSPLVHPCDGELTIVGKIDSGSLIQAKGLKYSVAELVQDSELAKRLEGGGYATYYLCPTDYHRVHSPCNGFVSKLFYQPGALWPVNHWSVRNVSNLFSKNERLIFQYRIYQEGQAGIPSQPSIENQENAFAHVVVVMVGATNVGKMGTPLAEKLFTNSWCGGQPREINFSPNNFVSVGQEIGIFNLGSTVILLWDKNLNGKTLSPQSVQMGGALII